MRKTLIYDIEMSHALAYVYPSNKPQFIGARQFKEHQFWICAAWRWQGQKKVHTVSLLDDPKRFKKNHRDDYHVVNELRKAVMEADVVVGHNVDGFDTKHLRWKMRLHKMDPLGPVKSVDTLKVARSLYNAPFKSMACLAEYLGIAQKGGVPLCVWHQACEGCPKAIKAILKYNKQDIVVTDDLYKIIRPDMLNHPSANAFYDEDFVCDICESDNMAVHKKRKIAGGQLRVQYQCQDCGGYKTPSNKEIKKWNVSKS